MSREVVEVLKKIDCDKYCGKFEENEIDYRAFLLIDKDTLDEMKIPIGPRLKILDEVKRLNTKSRDPGKGIL